MIAYWISQSQGPPLGSLVPGGGPPLTIIMEDERQGVRSCSDLPRVMGCPASMKYDPFAGVLDMGDKDYARDGEIVHSLLASPDPEIAEVQDATDDHRETAQVLNNFGDEAFTEFFGTDEWQVEETREQRLWAEDDLGQRWLTGRYDRHYVNLRGTDLLNMDWKSGWDPPDAEANWQMLGYNILRAEDSMTLERFGSCIVSRFGYDLAVYTRDEIDDARELLLDRLQTNEAATLDVLPHYPAPDRCRYCPGRAVCPHYPISLGKTLLMPPIKSMTSVQLARMRDIAKPVEDYIAATKAELKLRLAAGDPDLDAAGYFLANAGSTSRINQKALLKERFADILTGEEFTACMSVTLGTLRKLHKEKTGLRGDAAAEDFNDRIEPCVLLKPKDKSLRKRKT